MQGRDLSIRTKTTTGQSLLGDKKTYQVINMAEGSLSFDCPSTQNSSFERGKIALIRTTENLKRYIIHVHSNMYKKWGKVEIPTFLKGKKKWQKRICHQKC